ncbi:hypothetical protein WA026_016876 [Henosepilachna vigintioctopunctata]|uniref:Uncharacterized protein n=1 Tax=Henosepilachna vigintioctopunctata TaxID=420089 RepID=A0AAW1U8Y8_9CUCU
MHHYSRTEDTRHDFDDTAARHSVYKHKEHPAGLKRWSKAAAPRPSMRIGAPVTSRAASVHPPPPLIDFVQLDRGGIGETRWDGRDVLGIGVMRHAVCIRIGIPRMQFDRVSSIRRSRNLRGRGISEKSIILYGLYQKWDHIDNRKKLQSLFFLQSIFKKLYLIL